MEKKSGHLFCYLLTPVIIDDYYFEIIIDFILGRYCIGKILFILVRNQQSLLWMILKSSNTKLL